MVHPRFKKPFLFHKYKEQPTRLPPGHTSSVLPESTTGILTVEGGTVEPQVDMCSILSIHGAQIIVKYVQELEPPRPPSASLSDTEYYSIIPKPEPHDVQPGKRFTLLVGPKLFLAEIMEVSSLPNSTFSDLSTFPVRGEERSSTSLVSRSRNEIPVRTTHTEEYRAEATGSTPAQSPIAPTASQDQNSTMLDSVPVKASRKCLSVGVAAEASVSTHDLEAATALNTMGHRPKRRRSPYFDEDKPVKRNKRKITVSPERALRLPAVARSLMEDNVFTFPQTPTTTTSTPAHLCASKGKHAVRFNISGLPSSSTPMPRRTSTLLTNKPLPAPSAKRRLVATNLEEILAVNRANRAHSPAPPPPPWLHRVREPRRTQVLDRSPLRALRTIVIPPGEAAEVEEHIYWHLREERESDEEDEEQEEPEEQYTYHTSHEYTPTYLTTRYPETHAGAYSEEGFTNCPADPSAPTFGHSHIYARTNLTTGYPITAGYGNEHGYSYTNPNRHRHAAAAPTRDGHGTGIYAGVPAEYTALRGTGNTVIPAPASVPTRDSVAPLERQLTAQYFAKHPQVGIFTGDTHMIDVTREAAERLWAEKLDHLRA